MSDSEKSVEDIIFSHKKNKFTEKYTNAFNRVKQLFNNNIENDDFYDSIISGCIFISYKSFRKPFKHVSNYVNECRKCTDGRNVINAVIIEQQYLYLIPVAAISLLAIKNIFYDAKHIYLINKYYNKFSKLQKKSICDFKHSITISNMENNLNAYQYIASAKYISKYGISAALIAKLSTSKFNNYMIPTAFVCAGTYIGLKFLEKYFIKNYLINRDYTFDWVNTNYRINCFIEDNAFIIASIGLIGFFTILLKHK